MKRKFKWHKQERQFTCGPNAWRNLLLKFGIRAAEETIRSIMETNSSDGTDSNGILNAAEAYEFDYKEVLSTSHDVFGRKIIKALKSNHGIILLTKACEHWVYVDNYSKRYIQVVDGLKEDKERVTSYTLKELKQYAFNFDEFEKRSYFYFIEAWPLETRGE
jgi:ABC-type bacteriocin/lantibiotic exporter with double-glycine peptidase domain